MSRRRSNAPRQSRSAGPGGSADQPQRRGFLERLRVREREQTAQARSRAGDAVAPAPRASRSRSRRRGRTEITKFQILSIGIMGLLVFALVGSLFIPYLPGLSGGG